MGDGLLCEFGSLVDAVACAVAIQRGMAERETGVAEDQKIRFRIGVNTGDVIIDGDDIYGEGVNIAARLEGLAELGGICVSGRVRDEIARKLEVGFAPMGAQRVKNIAEPIEAWRVVLEPSKAPRPVHLARGGLRSLTSLGGAALALLLILSGGLWWISTTPRGPGTPDSPRLSLIVLPFENLSGDPDQDYFADGITEDLTTDLTRLPGSLVIARNPPSPTRTKRWTQSRSGAS
jgi:adenylate cyclase